MKVLLIEDDEETSAYVARGLREQGHVVDLAATGRDGLFLATDGGHDVLIVDRMLPGLDGIALVQALRGTGVKAPVLFLTALGGVGDRVRGLDAGGDDYLVKPFAFAELLARVNALARRSPTRRPGCRLVIWKWTCSGAQSRAAARRSICSRASSSCSHF
jgi:two-component system, OmpR family, response regulator